MTERAFTPNNLQISVIFPLAQTLQYLRLYLSLYSTPVGGITCDVYVHLQRLLPSLVTKYPTDRSHHLSDNLVMIGADVPDLPSPVEGFDFRLVKPTPEQKCWMVDIVIQKFETAASCAKKYHINRKSLHKLVRKRLQGLSMRFKPGRPPLLDAISLDSISASIRGKSCSTVSILRRSITEEFQASHDRRYPTNQSEEIHAKISRRSMKRYITRLEPALLDADIDSPESTSELITAPSSEVT